MNKLEMKGDWNIIKGKLKQKYGQLTDQDLTYAKGKEEELIGQLQKKTGAKREELEAYFRETGNQEYAAGRNPSGGGRY